MDDVRIRHLLNPEALADKKVLTVGLGSGGYPVIQQLTMCGVRKWSLIDMDELDEVNLVKHPGMRSELGRRKVDIAHDWIKDRNPDAECVVHHMDIRTDENMNILEDEVESADLVLVGTDNLNTREILNEMCVLGTTPAVFGMVYRTGFGGCVWLYEPGETGCFNCYRKIALNVNEQLDMIGEQADRARLTKEVEEELDANMYGVQGDPKYGMSGLSMDIQFISLLQARMALSSLLGHDSDKHRLRFRYDIVGKGKRDEEGNIISPTPSAAVTTWYDTEQEVGYRCKPRCSKCGHDAIIYERMSLVELIPAFCPSCGATLNYQDELNERVESDEDEPSINIEWRRLGALPKGPGWNYIMFANRGQIVDDLSLEDGQPTGRKRVMIKPFHIQTRLQPPRKDCSLCNPEGE